MRRNAHLFLTLLVLSVLLVGPAVADDTIYAGIDVWRTPDNGTSFYDFSADPLPAGFFCQRSEPFAGKIVLRGVPLVTAKAGQLPGADTIIHRLDDARFNTRGLASSRMQVRALSLEGTAPVHTACGSYQVKVSLTGDQPVTRMNLVRESAEGGRFLAPLAMNVKLTFLPLSARGRTVEAVRLVRFPANPLLRWSSDLVGRAQHVNAVKVDTDGDRVADTYLPGTSNFAVKSAPASEADKAIYLCRDAVYINPDGSTCHCDVNKEHCTEPLWLEM